MPALAGSIVLLQKVSVSDYLLYCLAETSERPSFCISTKSTVKKEKGGGKKEVSAKALAWRRI